MVISAIVNKDLLSGNKTFMAAPFLTIYGNNMTFSLWKPGLQQTGLTVTMILSCFFVDPQSLFMLMFVMRVQNYKKIMFLVGNNNHTNKAYFPCVFVFEIEQKFPVPVYI